MRDTVKPRIPAEVSSRITAVTKTSFINNSDETTTIDDVTIDDVWIPSEKEIFGGTSRESQGVYYCSVFNSATRRKKQKVNGTSVDYWWLRSAGSNLTHYEMVSTSGTIFSYHSEYGFGVALGFCT